MAVSNNSIVHYTKRLDSIKGILFEGFRLKYCCEKLSSAFEDNITVELAIPMVSFCDLPLSQIREHTDKFGKYGIGLTKEWARKYLMSPVIYFEQRSSICAVYLKSLEERLELFHFDSDQKPDSHLNDLIMFFLYAKNYEGIPIRPMDPENQTVVRFYNEREWRYVPFTDDLKGAKLFHLIENYIQNKEEYNKQLEELRLNFYLDELSYIIVDTAEEAYEIAKFIDDIYYNHASRGQITRAISKIFTQEQITNDF